MSHRSNLVFALTKKKSRYIMDIWEDLTIIPYEYSIHTAIRIYPGKRHDPIMFLPLFNALVEDLQSYGCNAAVKVNRDGVIIDNFTEKDAEDIMFILKIQDPTVTAI